VTKQPTEEEILTLHKLTIHEASEALTAGDITSVELTQTVIDRIAAVEDDVQAYLALTPEKALEQARLADERRAAYCSSDTEPCPFGPLLGVPLAIKDVLCSEGIPTTCGSRILEGFVPPYDASVVARLKAAGAVILGKTNTDEFAMGSSTENSAYFTTHNPWDLERVPGGSSGGSAAAIAADECLAALGTDTGGSVRQPASLCGVVGLKPTYGRVSRYGLIAFASSLDQIGVLTKDVTDAAILLGAIAGYDPRDSTSMNVPVPDYGAALGKDLTGVRIGVPREYFIEGLQPEVETAVRAAVDILSDLGAEVREISLPHTEYALPVYYLIAPAEASANLARYDGVRYGLRADSNDAGGLLEMYKATRGEGFGPEVKRRIMLGTYALSAGYYDAYYLKAQKVRTLIKNDFDAAYEEVDVIVGPTSPVTAFRIGEKIDDPLQMYLVDLFTLSMNLAGICGLSLPCGFDTKTGQGSLPIGLQITGPAFGEEQVLQVAHAYEQATDWHKRRPSL
jgi:aspartyl-tRNA(Asn)/glutamyl-tRNA(Gln) amidotransferase subunit A